MLRSARINKWNFYGIFLGLLTFEGAAQASDIMAGTANLEALLGSAYKSEKQIFAGDRCLNGVTNMGAGKASAGFTFQDSISENQLSSELGFNVGGRARSGVVEYSMAAHFLKNSVSNNLSVSAAWESSYTFPVDKLVATKADLNQTGKEILNNPSRWAETCGDEYVAEITKGAKLFFSIRVDFHSAEEKEAFEADFSISGPLAAADANLKNASKKFSRSTKVTVSAYQVGGDVSKITEIFDQSESGKEGFRQCQLSDFESCAKVIQKALTYATNTSSGFPSQLAQGANPGPAVLVYKTVPYSAIGIYPNNYPGLTESIKLARQEVSNAFEKHYRYAITANRLLQTKTIGDRRAEIDAEKEKVDRNLRIILGVSEICFNSPSLCWDTKDKQLRLEPINEKVFLPPTFAELCEKDNSSDLLKNTIAKIRLAVQSPASESCANLARRLKTTTSLNLSGSDRPEDSLDLRPIANLIFLQKLSLAGAKINDINPLSGLVNLKFLDLSVNHISELEPLSDMMDLVHLNLNYNQIENVSPLSGLLRLQRIYLANNRISHLSQLNFLPQLLSIDLRLNPLSLDELEGFRKRMPPAAVVQF